MSYKVISLAVGLTINIFEGKHSTQKIAWCAKTENIEWLKVHQSLNLHILNSITFFQHVLKLTQETHICE